MSYHTENTILTFAYGIIDLLHGFSFEKTIRALVPAIAFTYTLGIYAGDVFHKVRHTVESHLVLDYV